MVLNIVDDEERDCSSLLSFTHFSFFLPVPGPPLDLEGTPVGSNGILLSWTMPPDADIDGYVIR